ncbi:MAG: hypothetical protein UY44_C0020G0006 [Candidatus Kaiserbacteria bacterium GW2011_GWA2_49_19]|uniref:Uncharacterized protein n=1 Tax=Candidatus Kaiserbacteria bacterium GW2011_GWA2_49_19 TaxID=1618669 RepID=A0A0G1VNX7_9BACT|nr:MAG: hypothetical protein UY44_C0020G0006 [Candidatus Kaiserbacteria bacterium GW2011_GWA2_49_19]
MTPPAASSTTSPLLYVFKVKSEEPKVSPASIYKGAEDFIYEANRLDAVPLAPIFNENKSPVLVVLDPGDQSSESILPVVKPVEVEVIPNTLPDDNELAAIVAPFVVVPELII